MKNQRLQVLLASFILAWASSASVAQPSPPEVFDGPYQGAVTRIVDGDTIEALVFIWPDIQAVVSVRLAGIEAPELDARYCRAEVVFGQLARNHLEEELPLGRRIILENVRLGAFAGRVVADVLRDNPERDRSIADQMLAHDDAFIAARAEDDERPNICNNIARANPGR